MKKLFLLMALMFPLIGHMSHATNLKTNRIQEKLARLEKSFDGKIGIYALNTQNGDVIAYRENEYFPIQSTFKAIAVALLLKQSESNPALLDEVVHYKQDQLVPWHPITGKHLTVGMPYRALAAAAISYSDNPAANIILEKIGGLAVLLKFAKSIGNTQLTLKHLEPNLNSNPNNRDDSSTPKAMALMLQQLLLGKRLAPAFRDNLYTWMLQSKNQKRMRAGVPSTWLVADKTGSGRFGIANDIGLVIPPSGKPIVLAIYTVRNKADSKWRDDIIAETTRMVLAACGLARSQ